MKLQSKLPVTGAAGGNPPEDRREELMGTWISLTWGRGVNVGIQTEAKDRPMVQLRAV